MPQNCERVIIVGFRNDLNVKEFNFPKKLDRIVTLREAFGDLPDPKPEDVCDDPSSSRFMSRNRKRKWDEVSYTIPAMAKQVPLHPASPDMERLDRDLWKFGDSGPTRRFSWQEAAAIQTFPPNMKFVGDLTSKYKQIGNAVPVKLAESIAKKVYETFEQCLDYDQQQKISEEKVKL